MLRVLLISMMPLDLIFSAATQGAERTPRVAEHGIETRIPWTTSRVVGSPDPPLPLRAVRAFPNLTFASPLYIIAEPAAQIVVNQAAPNAAAGRMFVVQQRGKILAFANDPLVEKTYVFLALDDRDTYGMTFHPRYSENRFVFVFSNGPNSNEKRRQNRISRFVVSREGACDPASETIIIEWESNGHNGGDLAFGPDGMLYASAGPEEYRALPNPENESAGLEERARSYLHANCAQCHVEAGGGNAAMEMKFTTPREKTRIMGAVPLHDKFGIENAKLIAPGDPARSVLLRRLALRGRGQMPPLATSLVDEAGVTLLREWIDSLPKR